MNSSQLGENFYTIGYQFDSNGSQFYTIGYDFDSI